VTAPSGRPLTKRFTGLASRDRCNHCTIFDPRRRNCASTDIASAVVGGIAVSVRAEPRFTRDLDFAVAVASDDEAASYVFRIRQHGYEIVAALEQTTQHRLSTIRLRRDGRGPIVDLLFAASGHRSAGGCPDHRGTAQMAVTCRGGLRSGGAVRRRRHARAVAARSARRRQNGMSSVASHASSSTTGTIRTTRPPRTWR
jgi:hypothetical protein